MPRALGIERTGLTRWDFDELPRVIDTPHGARALSCIPTLVDEAEGVAIRLLTSAADQAAMPLGVRRLLLAAVPSPVAYVASIVGPRPRNSTLATTTAASTRCWRTCRPPASTRSRAVPDGQELRAGAVFETTRDRVSAVVMEQMFQTHEPDRPHPRHQP